MKGGELFIADLVRAVRRLGLTTDTEVERVARILGLERDTSLPSPRKPPLPPPTPKFSPKRPDAQKQRNQTEGWPKTPRRLGAVRHEPPSTAAPSWFFESDAFPRETRADFEFVPEYTPLFQKKQTRAILSAALAVRLNEGEIDVDALVDRRARREPVVSVPRRPVASLRRGAQVLLDRREAMMPFFIDQNQLVDDLQAVVGRDRLVVLQFLDLPEQVIAWGGHEDAEQAYQPPHAPGTPILLVSDLGIGVVPLAPTVIEDANWLSLAARARQARCPLVALVPYPAARWPVRVSHAMLLLEWDRPTRPGSVRRRVGPGHTVK